MKGSVMKAKRAFPDWCVSVRIRITERMARHMRNKAHCTVVFVEQDVENLK